MLHTDLVLDELPGEEPVDEAGLAAAGVAEDDEAAGVHDDMSPRPPPRPNCAPRPVPAGELVLVLPAQCPHHPTPPQH